MNDLLKYSLLAAGGYFLYSNYFGATKTPLAPAGPSTSEPTTPAPNPSQNPVPTSSPSIDLGALMRAAAGKPNAADLLNFDQWNYYYSKVRGVAGPQIEDVFPGLDRNYLMTFDEWKSGVAKVGI